MVQEVIKCCKEMKIKRVGWNCREDNVASYKLAEKVGFTKQDNYNCYHGWYNKVDNYLIN